MDGILSPAFMQAACAHKAPEPPVHENVIKLLYTGTTGNAQKINIAGNGDITIFYIENGSPKSMTVTDPHYPVIEIYPDNDEMITIKGNVTDITCYGPPAQYISSNVDVSECDTLSGIIVGGQYFTVLKCRANSQSLVNDIVECFTDEVSTVGTLFTNKDDEYYSELEAAVLAKGWTIEEL